jgi:CheY-like chemotaxis protein
MARFLLGENGPRMLSVLIVEDDSPTRTVIADVLQDAGYGIVEAPGGLEALDLLRERRVDLVVLDLMMPGMSGWLFLERARDYLQQTHIPVVIVSAIKGFGDYPAMLGAAAWFNKPLDMTRFLAEVETLVGPPRRANLTNAQGSRAGRRVLIVEDEQTIRDILRDHLDGEGYSAEVAGSIAEARKRIGNGRPDVILLDLMLPGQDGWGFLRKRRADPDLVDIPVLAISAAPHDRLQEAKELGADGFLSKPLDLDVLSAVLRDIQSPLPS